MVFTNKVSKFFRLVKNKKCVICFISDSHQFGRVLGQEVVRPVTKHPIAKGMLEYIRYEVRKDLREVDLVSSTLDDGRWKVGAECRVDILTHHHRLYSLAQRRSLCSELLCILHKSVIVFLCNIALGQHVHFFELTLRNVLSDFGLDIARLNDDTHHSLMVRLYGDCLCDKFCSNLNKRKG